LRFEPIDPDLALRGKAHQSACRGNGANGCGP
jgi:hypothetical protein